MELDLYILDFEEQTENALVNFNKNLSRISVGGANPELFKQIQINYYDSYSALIDLCSISYPEPQQLLIKPYDKKSTHAILNAIDKQNYSITAQDEGDQIRIIFPVLTQQRRMEEAKKISKVKEEAKIKVRAARQHIMKAIKKDEELSEDEQKLYQDKIQNLVDKKIELIDSISDAKEKELLKL